MESARIVRDFVAAWSRLDPAELARWFTEEGIYHNMPMPDPVVGRAKIEEFIRSFTASWTWTEWEIVTLLAEGDRVVAERVDRIAAGERRLDLPVTGVFEIEGSRIRAWRDYFDLGTYMRTLG